LLKQTGQTEVIAHPDIWDIKYGRHGGQPFYIGIPFRREELESLGAVFKLSREPVSLGEGIMTTGEVPMTTSYEAIDQGLFVKHNGEMSQDPLADDLSLIIPTEKGLIVILGCAHRGVINHLRQAQKVTGNNAIHAVIGGTHLFRAPESQIEQAVKAMKEMKVEKLGLSHCTGFPAAARIAQEFGNRFFLNNAGTSFTLP
jgi:7,8-dihydropterin-6-yl-methyl-4-(beta-D-ribofuranosyl)aminobenzene 5'-phosphate synthase